MSEVEWDYYDSGTLWCETPWVNGQIHGVRKWYYEGGTLEYEIPYVDGQAHGVQKWYHKDGTLYRKTYWVNGQRRKDLTLLDILVLFGEEA